MTTIRFILFCLATLSVVQVYGQSSVLGRGKWFKVAIETRGVYKISLDQFKKMGFDPKSDPRKIQVYGNSGGMLPQPNSVSRPVDLTENAIYISGEADGSFDNSDYILFFAEGADQIRYDAAREIFAYENNLYSDKNFYFVTVGDVDGKRILTTPNVSGNFPLITHFDDYAHHERNEFNVLSSGREWFGERFDGNQERSFSVDISNIVDNTTIKIVSDVMGQSYGSSSFNVFWNGVSVLNQSLSSLPNTPYGIKGVHKRDTVSVDSNVVNASSTTAQDIKYQFNKAASGASSGFLDFFLLNYKRNLVLSARQMIFRSKESIVNPVSTYAISNVPENSLIWNVTQHYNPQQQHFSWENNNAQFSAASDLLQEYIIFDSNVPSPELVSEVENQDLHGLPVPNFIIISHSSFLSEAQRLAAHRQQHNAWAVTVVTPEKIYHEFSSGRQDVTAIRDFIKYTYDKNPTVLKAVLFLGKGSFDYKDWIRNNTNFVPTYESRNSLSPLATYSSDDYFAFLENNEGNWGESPVQNHTLDIGVGRLPVKTLAEAKNVVDKIIYYDTNKKGLGRWRKDIVFVGDDGNNADNFTSSHQSQANAMAEAVESSHLMFDTKKIFLGKYEKTPRPNGSESIPEARKDVLTRFDRGSLIINFTGHGNEKQWTDEKIFSDEEIDQLENKLYPFLVTATCEFGRQDDPTVVSSAELSVLRPNGGAIGLVTTSRPVNASTNFFLNQEFYEALFQKQDSRYGTLGEVFRNTKNNSMSGVANRNFSLLADPSMSLAMPSESVIITEIKTSTGSDTLKALSTVTIKGEVHDEAGAVNENFNGVLEVTLFDKKVEFITTGKNNPPFKYNEWFNALYRGKASVTNGTFEAQFVLTKNVDEEIGQGKLSLYAYDPTTRIDASGGSLSFKIGGTEPDVSPDNAAPVVSLFMGDSTFISGGLVSPNATLIVSLQDDHGINISGGENSLVAHLDDGEVYILNDYYEAYIDDFTKGSVYFPLKDLQPGRHTITVKAWDTFNNPGEATIEFVVSDSEALAIETLGNFPNPFQSETSVFFTHNRPGDDLLAQLVIYGADGMQLKTYDFDIPLSEYLVELGEINDLYDFGKKLPGGIYLARLTVRSLTNGSKNERVTKLIVVN